MTLAGAGLDATSIRVPTGVTSGALISITGGTAVDVSMSGFSVLDNGAPSETGILNNACNITADAIEVAGFASGVVVERTGTASITDSSIINDTTGIVVGANAGDLSGLIANFNDLADDSVGVQNNQGLGSVFATFNYWGSTSGPTTSANPGGSGAASVGGVLFSPWLGDTHLNPYDYLVFSTTAADRYTVTPVEGNTILSVTDSITSPTGTPSGTSLGTIPGGGTLGFVGSGGTVTIMGETGPIADGFNVQDTSVQYQAADGLKGTTVIVSGTAITVRSMRKEP